MIVSRGRRYIFVHIPKTGGTSLSVALEARAMRDDILIGDTPKAVRRRKRLKHLEARGRLWKHSTLRDIEGVLSEKEMRGMFVFTLVRNPWDRILSYYHWLRAQDFAHPAVALAKRTAFSTFLGDPATQASLEGHPSASYVTLPSGEERCDAFVRIEHAAEDLAPVERHLGFGLGPLPRLNTSRRPVDYRAAYSDGDAALVARLCAKDVARFGYRFERDDG